MVADTKSSARSAGNTYQEALVKEKISGSLRGVVKVKEVPEDQRRSSLATTSPGAKCWHEDARMYVVVTFVEAAFI